MPSCSPLLLKLRKCTAEPKGQYPPKKAVASLASFISSSSDSDSYLSTPPPPVPSRPLQERIRNRVPDLNWARSDQLSTILESVEGSKKSTPNPSLVANLSSQKENPDKKTAYLSRHNYKQSTHLNITMSERRSSSLSPKMIRPPPRDLESISRIDASLVFEHFTTTDAWELGSSLRNRLLPIPTPVVINISLANQNQSLFHTVTHSGVMPDNETWVERKRRTVLRWGCSTWFMACKFGGDEVAFREKYGLGNSAGKYAIHGGGVPIRVTGVEGVVAVVVVSGLKHEENHAVIVEVIKDLYY